MAQRKQDRTWNQQTPRRKRRTREHVIADLSANYVERLILRCGFVAEQIRHDYGIDMFLFFYNSRGERRDGQVLLQLKASNRLRLSRDKKNISFRIQKRDLGAWLSTFQPVILLLYDAVRDRAWWLYVQEYFRRKKNFKLAQAKPTITVYFPLINRLDMHAIRRFEKFSDAVVGQWIDKLRLEHD